MPTTQDKKLTVRNLSTVAKKIDITIKMIIPSMIIRQSLAAVLLLLLPPPHPLKFVNPSTNNPTSCFCRKAEEKDHNPLHHIYQQQQQQ
jgi:hypothetical protein